MRLSWLMVLGSVGLAACSTSGTASTGCKDNSECRAGSVCLDGSCVEVCTNDSHCDGDLVCIDGACVAGTREGPTIQAVSSNGSADSTQGHNGHHLATRLTIDGANLQGAEVTLSAGQEEYTLDKCEESATQLVVALPAGLTEDTYTLTVANQAGSCDATVPMLVGETGPEGPEGPPGVPCDGCVTTASLAAGAVDAAALQDGAVGAAEIDDTEVQARLVGTCSADQAIAEVDATGEVSCVGPFARPWSPVFTDDFQQPPSSTYWSFTTLSTCNNQSILGGYDTLGNGVIGLSLDNLPPHTEFRVIFDLFVIDSWDYSGDSAGYDIFRLDMGSETDRVALFAINPARLGDANLCGQAGDDHVRRIDVTAFHSASTLVLSFVGRTNEAASNESWGIDNVTVLVR